MSFFAELKRRNVFKVGVAYAIVAWLIVQVISAIHTPLHLPDWFDTVVIVLLIIGFILAIILAWAYELTPEGIKTTTPEGPAQYHTRTTGQRLNYFIVGVLVLVVAFIVIDNYVLKYTGTSTIPTTTVKPDIKKHSTTPRSTTTTTPTVTASPVRRYELSLGLTRSLQPTQLNAIMALSRDGLHLVYAVNRSEGVQLQYRNLNQLSSQSLALPTGPVTDVFVSPDGEWVGVTINNALYKVSIQGGAPQLLTGELRGSFGGHWTADGTIYFNAVDNNTLKLYRVQDTGGTPEPVPVTGGKAEDGYTWPYALPGGTHVLATQAQSGQAGNGRIVLVDLNTGEPHVLIQNGYRARYVPTGHIVFMRSGSLWAVPFDVEQLATTGPEVPVVQGVEHGSVFGPAVYAFSDEGLLVYLPGGDVQGGAGATRQLVWVDRDGTETPLPAKAQFYLSPRLSPDGTQVAVTVGNLSNGFDIWTYDLARNILSRRTFSGNAQFPLWTPDGSHLVYTFLPINQGLSWIRADGTGQPEKLIDAPRFLLPSTFTPDGSTLIYYENLTGPVDISTLSLSGEHTEQPLLATEFSEGWATLSPDGRWLAYVSNETGQWEIYVRPYPNVDGGKWQVSTDGGIEPHWRGDGRELFYRKPGNEVVMLAVPVKTENGFEAGTPAQLFRGDYYIPGPGITYDVTADGQRFLFTKTVIEAGADETVESRETNLVVVENWFAELKRLAPPAH